MKLGDLANIMVGFPFKSEEFNTQGRGVHLVRGKNVTRGTLRFGSDEFWWDDYTDARIDGYRLREDDVVIGMDGSRVGQNFARVTNNDLPALLVQRVACLRAKSGVSQDFLYAAISNGRFTRYVEQSRTGTSIPHISSKQIAEFEIPDLDPGQMWAVGSFTRNIDDLVNSLSRTNDYLEQCLLAQYDHLFGVDDAYDGTIADIGDVIGGATPSKKKPEYYCSDGIGWITPRDLSNTADKFIAHGADDITQLGYDSCSVKMLPAGTVLFSSRAPIGYIAIAADNVTTNQGFKSVVPHEGIGTAFVYCFLKRNKERIADAGSGTTFPEVSGKTMAGIELSLPDIELCTEFSEWAEPLLNQQRCLEEENRELGELRDALLPKLMTGEIDVSDIELPTPPNNHL